MKKLFRRKISRQDLERIKVKRLYFFTNLGKVENSVSREAFDDPNTGDNESD